MFNFISSYFYQWVDPGHPVDNDPVVNDIIKRLKDEKITTTTCIFRTDINNQHMEYYINYNHNLELLTNYIQQSLQENANNWRIRTWDDTWANSLDVGYLIELNDIKNFISKKFWLFNLTLEQQKHLNELFIYYS